MATKNEIQYLQECGPDYTVIPFAYYFLILIMSGIIRHFIAPEKYLVCRPWLFSERSRVFYSLQIFHLSLRGEVHSGSDLRFYETRN